MSVRRNVNSLIARESLVFSTYDIRIQSYIIKYVDTKNQTNEKEDKYVDNRNRFMVGLCTMVVRET